MTQHKKYFNRRGSCCVITYGHGIYVGTTSRLAFDFTLMFYHSFAWSRRSQKICHAITSNINDLFFIIDMHNLKVNNITNFVVFPLQKYPSLPDQKSRGQKAAQAMLGS